MNSKCHIVTAIGVEVLPIHRILDRARISYHNSLTSAAASELFNAEQFIGESDFIFAACQNRADANFIFELGIAVGLKKPIFLVVSGDVELPLSLLNFSYVRANLEDVEAIYFQFDLFVKNVNAIRKALTRKPKYKKETSPDTASFNQHTLEFSESEWAFMTANALRAAGIEFVSDPIVSPDKPVLRPDIIAWLPTTTPDLGNPVLFELKGRVLHNPADAIYQVKRYIAAAKLKTGVLVAKDTSGVRSTIGDAGTLILVVSFEELLSALSQGDLPGLLREKRNELFHGKG